MSVLQLRHTVFQFAQKELAPKAAEIDRDNTFKEMKVSTLQRMHVNGAYFLFQHQIQNEAVSKKKLECGPT